MTTQEIIELYNKYVIPSYRKLPFAFVKGKGSKIYDAEGKEYLDLFPGWGVSGLGHCHPAVVNAIKEQAKSLLHLPNNYYNELQGKLAEKLIKNSFDGKVFFANSGAEANEGAVKLARRFGHDSGRFEIIAMNGSFHGRTLAGIALTGQHKYQEGFEPMPEGFKHAPFNDIKAVESAVTDKTVAVILEPIQGEGGVNVADADYVKALRRLCDEKKMLLVFDEVQTGIGRTGKMFCYEHYGVTPDIMTLAKSLGGGMPIGALVAKREFADLLSPGTHASTFGGSPIVAAAALAVFETIEKENILENVNKLGEFIFAKLARLKKRYHIIKDVRGKGLMVGVELSIEGKSIVEGALAKGLLINCTQDKVLRLLPALTVTKSQVSKALGILDEVIQNVIKG